MSMNDPVSEELPPETRRTWRAKFGDAARGIKLGVRGHSSFAVHFFAAVAVIASAFVLNVSLLEWCVLIGCIAAVIAAELFNTAVETLCRAAGLDRQPAGKRSLDIAAGAVLVAAIGSAVIGLIVFGTRLWQMLR